MNQTRDMVSILNARWTNSLAEEAVQRIAAEFWATEGQPASDVQEVIEQMRQLLKKHLGQTAVPTEQMRVMEISYRFEQGLGRHAEALSLAKNLRHLSERKADVLHQVRSAVLLAEAWHMVSEVALALEWCRRALQTAKPLEVKGAGGRQLRAVFVGEELRLAWLMALQGGTDESVDKLMNDAINRYKDMKDRAGQTAALGLWSQVRMLQGRWSDSIDLTRQSLAVSGTSSGASSPAALWAGARSASRAGDLPTAQGWIDQALTISRDVADVEARIAALLSHASILLLAGDDAALPAADAAVTLGNAWKMEILRRWAMLERSWLRLAAGKPDLEEMRATAASLAKSGPAPLEAEAWYALYHALAAAGQDGQIEYDKAREMFTRLKMAWHLAKVEAKAPLLGRPTR